MDIINWVSLSAPIILAYSVMTRLLPQFPVLSFHPIFYLVLQTHQSGIRWGSGSGAITSARCPLTTSRNFSMDGQET